MSELPADKPQQTMSELSSQQTMSELSSQRTMVARTPGELDGGDSPDVSRPISILINSVSLSEEDCIPAERTAQAKMQSVFQQVRKQVTSQGGTSIPRNGILELIQMVKSRELEIVTVNGPNDAGKTDAEILDKECTGEKNVRKEELIAVFQQELEASKDALRDEFKEQIAQLRTEMQAYTNKALKGLESKVKNKQTYSHNILQRIYQAEQSDTRSFEKKKKFPVTPLLGPGKTRVLSRTMTTLNPKTCPPIVLGPRSKSETLSTSRDNSGLLLKDPDFLSSPTFKYPQPSGPLPPTCPPHHNRKKPLRTKTQAGNANN